MDVVDLGVMVDVSVDRQDGVRVKMKGGLLV